MSSPVKMKTIHTAARNTKPCACAALYSELPDYTTWGAITTLLVGSPSSPTPLTIHTGILTHASPAFRAAFATNPSTGLPIWREGATLTYALPEEDPDAIAACLSWLYTRRLWPLSADADLRPHHAVPLSWETLVGAAIFAAVYEMHGLHNAVVSAIVDAVVQRWPEGDRPTHLIAEVYANVAAGQPLRTLFLHVGLLEEREWLLRAQGGDELPEEFWADVENYDNLTPWLRRVKEQKQKRQDVTDTRLVKLGGGSSDRYYYRELQNAFPRPADPVDDGDGDDDDDDDVKQPGELLLETRGDWMNMPVCSYLHIESEGPSEHVARKRKEREELDAYSMRLSNVAPPNHDIVIEGEYDDNGLRRLVGIWQHVRNLRTTNP